jgi:hypothetical protein
VHEVPTSSLALRGLTNGSGGGGDGRARNPQRFRVTFDPGGEAERVIAKGT